MTIKRGANILMDLIHLNEKNKQVTIFFKPEEGVRVITESGLVEEGGS
jgi:hypothetical protein